MEPFNRKKHWETIYNTKEKNEVSWFEPTPLTSLSFINEYNIPTHAKIIDVGGGDSLLVDNLLNQGFKDITVLDLSEAALNKAQQRLGQQAAQVKWIVKDVTDFEPSEQYEFWHDRATFHFLTKEEDINNYVDKVKRFIKPEGILTIGTFSENGPEKCSGIMVKQYSEAKLESLFSKDFQKLSCRITNHTTPFNTNQNFIFCCFKRSIDSKKSV
jgi:2-polyprenyl-3-methyl-5-hydroxy-6-metoxy-1,4-benzoquinol methylase